ncbi:hypothetical protein EJB05_19665 [Eragrostis curvula]|uniref:RRM domain-containing protein n=1 Tax=Eragrostis curvula TaxID=38414 RepID=A0A5J9UX18_9POAL|nr:hypothetical protein EJB05_19665 [Eragrostis curvula]
MVSSEESLERPRTSGSKPGHLAPETETFVERSLSADGPAAAPFCVICMQPVDTSEADMMRCSDDETSIRVTNLSKNTCENDLYDLVCQFGVLTHISLALDDKAGSHTQIGIVEFDQREDAEEAIKWLTGHSYDNLLLKVEWETREQEEASVPVIKEAYDPTPMCETCMQVVELSVHVTNLPENTCERDLYNLFFHFGVINNFYLILDEKTGSLCGIVEFDQREDAEMAISWINGHVYGEHTLQVKWATAADLSAQRRLN